MGEWQGAQDTWCFVKGGMGSVSNAIASSAADKGAHLFVSQVRFEKNQIFIMLSILRLHQKMQLVAGPIDAT